MEVPDSAGHHSRAVSATATPGQGTTSISEKLGIKFNLVELVRSSLEDQDVGTSMINLVNLREWRNIS